MYSLRRALAVRFSFTIFVALLLIALWAYLGARRILREALDRNLAAAAQLEAAVLASRLPIAIHHDPMDIEQFTETVNRFIAVRDSNASILEANTMLASDLPLDAAAFERALAGQPVWSTARWQHGELRSYYAPAPPGSRTQLAVLQVAASLGPLQATSRQVLLLMFGTVLLGTAASALGAGWLASSAVAPVEEITAQAEAVQPGAVGQQITAHADALEFAGLVRVLNRTLDRLEHAFESQRRLIADTGHDLRTPLTAMRGWLEVALRGERRAEEYRATLTNVLEEVDYLTAISESLILVARLEAGTLTPERRKVDIGNLVEGATRHACARSEGRDIRYAGPDGETTASIDSQMVTVAVSHLLDNAIKHTPTGTRIRVTVAADADQVRITVDDSGAGIAPDLLPHLFQHFYRADVARSRSGATGLGLTVVAAIVAAHRGTVRADTSPLGGLRVIVALPRVSPTPRRFL